MVVSFPVHVDRAREIKQYPYQTHTMGDRRKKEDSRGGELSATAPHGPGHGQRQKPPQPAQPTLAFVVANPAFSSSGHRPPGEMSVYGESVVDEEEEPLPATPAYTSGSRRYVCSGVLFCQFSYQSSSTRASNSHGKFAIKNAVCCRQDSSHTAVFYCDFHFGSSVELPSEHRT